MTVPVIGSYKSTVIPSLEDTNEGFPARSKALRLAKYIWAWIRARLSIDAVVSVVTIQGEISSPPMVVLKEYS